MTSSHYVQEGSGPVVFLSHALGTHLGMWDEVAANLKKRFTVIRFIIRERTHYSMILNIEKEITGKKLPSEEKEKLLKKLEMINKQALQHFVPVGEEPNYFLFLNALQLLRNKIERN